MITAYPRSLLVPQLSRLIQGLQSRKANWQKTDAPPLEQGKGQGAGATIQTSKELLQSPPPPRRVW